MANYICKKKCYYDVREWRPGDTLVSDSKDVPKHFEKVKNSMAKAPSKPVKEKVSEPKTMIDLQNRDAKALLVGTRDDDIL